MAKKKLLKKVREEIRRRNYSYRTEKAYVRWIIRFVKFNKLTHPKNLDEEQVVDFLNWLANKRNVAASTQNQALCAIIFLYDHVLNQPWVNWRISKELKNLNGFPSCSLVKK